MSFIDLSVRNADGIGGNCSLWFRYIPYDMYCYVKHKRCKCFFYIFLFTGPFWWQEHVRIYCEIINSLCGIVCSCRMCCRNFVCPSVHYTHVPCQNDWMFHQTFSTICLLVFSHKTSWHDSIVIVLNSRYQMQVGMKFFFYIPPIFSCVWKTM